MTEPTVTVLAVGNPIMGDDGVGLVLLDGLQAIRPDQRIEYVDGGTGGMALLPLVMDAENLLVLDAVAGDQPGQVVCCTGDQLPRLLAAQLSPHQVGLLDVLASARLLGREPHQLVVVGVVPSRVELRLGLTEPVTRALTAAVAAAAQLVDRWLSSGSTASDGSQIGVNNLEFAPPQQLASRLTTNRASQSEKLVDQPFSQAARTPDSGGHLFDLQPGGGQHSTGSSQRPDPVQGLRQGPAERTDPQTDRFNRSLASRTGRLDNRRYYPAQQAQLMHQTRLAAGGVP